MNNKLKNMMALYENVMPGDKIAETVAKVDAVSTIDRDMLFKNGKLTPYGVSFFKKFRFKNGAKSYRGQIKHVLYKNKVGGGVNNVRIHVVDTETSEAIAEEVKTSSIVFIEDAEAFFSDFNKQGRKNGENSMDGNHESVKLSDILAVGSLPKLSKTPISCLKYDERQFVIDVTYKRAKVPKLPMEWKYEGENKSTQDAVDYLNGKIALKEANVVIDYFGKTKAKMVNKIKELNEGVIAGSIAKAQEEYSINVRDDIDAIFYGYIETIAIETGLDAEAILARAFEPAMVRIAELLSSAFDFRFAAEMRALLIKAIASEMYIAEAIVAADAKKKNKEFTPAKEYGIKLLMSFAFVAGTTPYVLAGGTYHLDAYLNGDASKNPFAYKVKERKPSSTGQMEDIALMKIGKIFGGLSGLLFGDSINIDSEDEEWKVLGFDGDIIYDSETIKFDRRLKVVPVGVIYDANGRAITASTKVLEVLKKDSNYKLPDETIDKFCKELETYKSQIEAKTDVDLAGIIGSVVSTKKDAVRSASNFDVYADGKHLVGRSNLSKLKGTVIAVLNNILIVEC